MNPRVLQRALGLSAGIAPIAASQSQPPLQRLHTAIYVEALAAAPAGLRAGEVIRTGDWVDLRGGPTRSTARCRVFDCFGDSDSDGFMDDSGGCGMDSSRWYFGTAYCNGMVTNDMHDVPLATGYGRADFAWYWACNHSGEEQCVIGIFTQESSPDSDLPSCEPDSFDYEGWLIDFGMRSCQRGYFYANVDISSVGYWPAVRGGDGSYVIAFLTDDGNALASCAQPMLWGAGNNAGGPVDGPGKQETPQLDDDDPRDGEHQIFDECHTYNYGVCPDPLGAMLQFWGDLCGPCDYADCNDSGATDTQDFLCFLNRWAAGDARADCNADGRINTLDFTCFLIQWNDCRA